MKKIFLAKATWCILLLTLVISVTDGPSLSAELESQSRNAALTSAAWKAFNAGNYSEAIATAWKVIDEFGEVAGRKQADLEKRQAPTPPKRITTQGEKQKIFDRGLLNDAATCWFIIGFSHEKLNHIAEARNAFLKAAEYTYARAWDPRGWFWSPAEAAKNHLKVLGE